MVGSDKSSGPVLADILTGVGEMLGTAGALVPDGWWKVALVGVSAASKFLGKLAARGIQPPEAIARWESAMTEKRAVDQDIDDLIDGREGEQ
jgi:hypothetical protein